jgi:DNA polymerase-3 subunit delta
VTPPIAFFWGDDDLAAGRAVDRLAAELGSTSGGPVERFEVRGDRTMAATLIGQLHERLATESMFGGGSLATVTNVGALTVKGEDRDALIGLLGLVAPGNGIAFIESTQTGTKEPGQKRLVEAIRSAGGEVRAFNAPKAGQLAAWIEREAGERDMRLDPGAAKELATRLGGFVVDNDADRRNQTRMAAHELDKLSLYRPGEAVSADDVKALVPEAVPGSVWALTDAIGLREPGRASVILERLVGSTPEPVLLSVLHRRIRELIEVGDRLRSGTQESTLPRLLGIHPYRVQQLANQARRWSIEELERALEGLLELDATVKGAPGAASSESQRRLGFTLWLAEHVAPR